MEWVLRVRGCSVDTRRGCVQFARVLHVQGLMRAVVVELLDEVECIIVDRWGTQVFGPIFYQNNTAKRAWDGTKNGKQLPNGAYYYSLKYTAKATKRVQRGIIYLVDGL